MGITGINLAGFGITKQKHNPLFIEKGAYQEGVYSDSPANRKLGRVGMSYKQYEEKLKKDQENLSHKDNKQHKTDSHKKDDGEEYSPSDEEVEEYEAAIPKPNVVERWDAYSLFCNMVSTGITKSLVAFGTGGVGKTFTMMQELDNSGLKEFDSDANDINHPGEFDYVKITGSASGLAVYKALFEYNDKLIIFDDCDSVLKDQNAVNFLKGALDSSGDGSISYSSSSPLKTDKLEGAAFSSTGIPMVPNRFKFTGKVMVISNLSPQEMPQPLIDSRCLSIDLSMSKEETIDRIKSILPKMKILDASGKPLKLDPEDKEKAINFLDKYKHSIREGKLNARTLGNIVKIIHASKGTNVWESAALALLSN